MDRLEEIFPEQQKLDKLQSNVNKITENDLNPESFNEILENDVLNVVHEPFQKYLNKPEATMKPCQHSG